jgi:hypothetical protein
MEEKRADGGEVKMRSGRSPTDESSAQKLVRVHNHDA